MKDTRVEINTEQSYEDLSKTISSCIITYFVV